MSTSFVSCTLDTSKELSELAVPSRHSTKKPESPFGKAREYSCTSQMTSRISQHRSLTLRGQTTTGNDQAVADSDTKRCKADARNSGKTTHIIYVFACSCGYILSGLKCRGVLLKSRKFRDKIRYEKSNGGNGSR